jgi:predicted MFS family arabinose efflux permease
LAWRNRQDAVVGGALFDHSGYQATFAASAALLLIAALVTFLTACKEFAG